MNGPAAHPGTAFRHWLVLALLTGAFTALVGRTAFLQVLSSDRLQAEGDARYERVVRVMPSRGMILDRNGEPLAVSTPVESLWAEPREFCAARPRWRELTKPLGVASDRLAALCERHAGRGFMYLRRHLAPDAARGILGLGVPGVYALREYRRFYPTGPVAAHVLGFTNVDDEGQEGIEMKFERQLAGVAGEQRVHKDRLGRVVETIENLRAVEDGHDLVISIDSRIQYLAYRQLQSAVERHRAAGGSAVVLDARSGEILALVNSPSINPNDRGDRRTARFRNRAVTDIMEPGSTIKPFTIAMALESGRYGPDTRVDTAPGLLHVGRRTIRDVHDYGLLTVGRVVSKSSNVGVAKIALSLESARLMQMLAGVGFGVSSDSGLPGEVGGYLPVDRRLRDIEHATIAYGYGLSATPLQLARAYTVFARDGELIPVTLQKTTGTVRGMRVMSVATARAVRAMLEQAASSEGTGAAAQVPRYRVAGKTGTVHKLDADGRYADRRYLSLFAGLAPVSEPRLVMVVVIDNPEGEDYFGGKVAAPVFARVMEGALRVLNVAPDLEPVDVRHADLTSRPGDDA